MILLQVLIHEWDKCVTYKIIKLVFFTSEMCWLDDTEDWELTFQARKLPLLSRYQAGTKFTPCKNISHIQV
jgi:hypothetical protein